MSSCGISFQVVPPCGGHQKIMGYPAGGVVSSRAPVWGASCDPRLACIASQVSSRAPVWGASAICGRRARSSEFQVVPPCGGHQRPNAVSSERLGFKSCPRVGGIHILASIPHGLRAVSSRAPVWGASSHIKNISEKGVVSSRAPVWGASGYE